MAIDFEKHFVTSPFLCATFALISSNKKHCWLLLNLADLSCFLLFSFEIKELPKCLQRDFSGLFFFSNTLFKRTCVESQQKWLHDIFPHKFLNGGDESSYFNIKSWKLTIIAFIAMKSFERHLPLLCMHNPKRVSNFLKRTRSWPCKYVCGDCFLATYTTETYAWIRAYFTLLFTWKWSSENVLEVKVDKKRRNKANNGHRTSNDGNVCQIIRFVIFVCFLKK